MDFTQFQQNEGKGPLLPKTSFVLGLCSYHLELNSRGENLSFYLLWWKQVAFVSELTEISTPDWGATRILSAREAACTETWPAHLRPSQARYVSRNPVMGKDEAAPYKSKATGLPLCGRLRMDHQNSFSAWQRAPRLLLCQATYVTPHLAQEDDDFAESVARASFNWSHGVSLF